MRASLQINVSKIAIIEVRAAAQLSWWLKLGNVLIQRVLFLLSVVVFFKPFLCVLDEALTCRLLSYGLESKHAAVVQCCRPPLSSVMEEMTWLHSHAKTTIKSPNATQNIVQPMPKVQSNAEYL